MGLFGKMFGRKARPVNFPVAKPVHIPTAGKVTGPVLGRVPVAPPVHIPLGRKVDKPRRVVGRGSAPTGTRDNPMYTVPTEGLQEFLAGELVGVTSSWHWTAQYDVVAQALYVTFLDGHRVRVTPVSSTEAASYYESASKGGWYHSFVMGPNYVRGNRATGRKTVEDA